jgi:hypothetical protein
VGTFTRIARQRRSLQHGRGKHITVQRNMACFNVYCFLYTLMFRRLLSYPWEVTLVSQTGANGPSEYISTLLKTCIKRTIAANNQDRSRTKWQPGVWGSGHIASISDTQYRSQIHAVYSIQYHELKTKYLSETARWPFKKIAQVQIEHHVP